MNERTLASIGRRMSVPELEMLLLERIARRRPASIVRFNDGEAKLLGTPAFYAQSQLTRMLERWFRDNRLSLDQLERLRAGLAAAIRNADVVGCPDADWPAEFARANAVLASLAAGHPLATVLVNFPQAMILDGFLQKTLTGIDFLGLVTSRDVRGVVRHMLEPRRSAWCRVPEQALFCYEPHLPRHFPEMFDFLCASIEVPFQGAVFLVGAGPCGKIYCDVIKRRGGIAIDIGSVFDVWAGRLTRPEMDFTPVRSYYERVVAVPAPRDDDVLALAEIHQNDGDLGRSIDLLRMVLRLRPGSVPLTLKCIECLLLVGDLPSAKGLFEALAQAGTPGTAVSRAAARLFMDHGHRIVAGEILAQALYVDPTDIIMLRLALMVFTEADLAVPPPPARLHADLVLASVAALQAQPGDHTLCFNFARYLGANGDVAQAICWGERAIMLFPIEIAYYPPVIAWLGYVGRASDAGTLAEAMAALESLGPAA
ncbi:hypothetical protein [Lichenicoccus sp.]|uniref:hypothetical protein n=1 Tax=Lichenicoccus sp. TaxID=2781899 RepID=UPI003D120AE5